MRIKKNSRGGFTMVELLGVVAIIALLSTIAITSLQGGLNAARSGAYNREIQILNTSYQTYIAAGGNLPPYTSNNRSEKKDNSKLAVSLLIVPLNTPFGVVGPFVTQEPTNWYLGDYMGSTIASETRYIGFDPALGFQDIGAD